MITPDIDPLITPDGNEYDPNSLLLAHNPRFVQLLEDARRVQVGGGVSLADFRRQLEADNEHSQASESE